MLHAVCVGIDRYSDPDIPDLSCARSDAAAVASVFERRLVPAERNVRLLVDERATRRGIAIAVDEMSSVLTEDDIGIVYFAGHGSPEKAGPRDAPARYLLPYDAALSRIHATALGMETDIPMWLKQLSEARVVLVVLDCCFSGAAGGRTVMGPLLRVAGMQALSGPAPISLKGLKLGEGRIILCASDEEQVAREDPAAGYGIFTRHFLAALTRARSTGPVIPITTLYDEVEEAVRDETAGAQEPISTFIPNKRAALPCLPDPDR